MRPVRFVVIDVLTENGPDYGAEVEKTFARFARSAVKSHLVKLRDHADMDHVEAQIAGLVARLYPDEFATLDGYCTRHRGYLDPVIRRFDREVQFYLAYLELVGHYQAAGLPFCYPDVSTRSKDTAAEETFDIALEGKLVPGGGTVVTNDFRLTGPERTLVVSGRTTAARRPSRVPSASCTTWQASVCPSPAAAPGCSCQTRSTPTSRRRRRRTSRRSAASSRTSSSGCTRSSGRLPGTASS